MRVILTGRLDDRRRGSCVKLAAMEAAAPAPADIRAPSWRGRVGVARRDITPPAGAPPGRAGAGAPRRDIPPPAGIYFRMWGAATYETAAGVHRPLTATALALCEPGAQPLALVAIDLPSWQNADDERFVREGVVEALGVDAARVVVNLSHTHAGLMVSREN